MRTLKDPRVVWLPRDAALEAVPPPVGFTRRGRLLLPVAGGAVTTKWFSSALMNAFGSTTAGNAPNIDWKSDTFKAMLTTSSYSPDQDAHDFKDDVTNELGAGSGYSTGGATITGADITYDSASNLIKFVTDPISWATFSAGPFRRCVVYDSTPGTDATRPLVCWIDFGSDVTGLGGTFTITPNANGLVNITVS